MNPTLHELLLRRAAVNGTLADEARSESTRLYYLGRWQAFREAAEEVASATPDDSLESLLAQEEAIEQATRSYDTSPGHYGRRFGGRRD